VRVCVQVCVGVCRRVLCEGVLLLGCVSCRLLGCGAAAHLGKGDSGCSDQRVSGDGVGIVHLRLQATSQQTSRVRGCATSLALNTTSFSLVISFRVKFWFHTGLRPPSAPTGESAPA
jgi:hypothetical protein